MSFYNNYISLCAKIGKSPSAVAVEIGLTKPTVNRWKNGSIPTDATIRRVANYFGIPVWKLKESGTIEDVIFEVARDNELHAAVNLLMQEKTAGQKTDGVQGDVFPNVGDEELLSSETLASLQETKKPADQMVDGLRGTGYYDLTPENRAMIDSLIDSLLKSQSAK